MEFVCPLLPLDESNATKYLPLLENVKEKPGRRGSGRKAGTDEIRTVTISSATILSSTQKTHSDIQIQRSVRIGRERRYVQ